jgi:uncharacterized membrane protein
MLALYAVSRVLQLYSGVIPILAIVILHVIPAAAFALIHGSRTYGPKGAVMFAAVCLGTGCFFESLSLRTGFPFGHYYFTSVMGPKVFQLPLLLALAYLGIGYVSWVLAVLILSGFRLFLVPVIAAFVMTAWDLSMEPVWATLDRAWIWSDGGAYFGVPISNFFGWYVTTYTFYQLFALYVRNRRPLPAPQGHWRLPVLFYAVCALGNLLLAIPSHAAIHFPAILTDASGHRWVVSDILAVCALVSVFVMLPFPVAAWRKTRSANQS